MSATSRFGFPFIAADQAQKHVTHNAALDMLDATIGGIVASATKPPRPARRSRARPIWSRPARAASATPTPATSRSGPAGPGPPRRRSSAAGSSRSIPARGWIYAGSWGWREGAVAGPLSGASAGLVIREAILTGLSGATVTATALIPARSIVLGVLRKPRSRSPAPASYKVGDAGDGARFGSSLGIALGSSNLGVIGPLAVYADTDVIVAPEAGHFTGGEVALAALLILPSLAV